MDLDKLPDDPLERLLHYQRARDEERERVEEALRKEPGQRTELDEVWLAYSPLGRASRCGC